MKKLLAGCMFVALCSVTAFARMEEQDINLALSAKILSEGNARIFPGSENRTVPLNDEDAQITVGWEEGVSDKWPMLEAALQLYTWPTMMEQGTKSRFVQDPKIDGTEYPGKWRQATISRIYVERTGIYWIVMGLRSGYATSAVWDEARTVETSFSESYAQTVTGATDVVTNSVGYDESQHIVVRFPNINPFKIQSVMATLNANTYTNPVVGTETLSGEWWNVLVSGGREDDGTGYVDLLLSRQRFTMKIYNLYGTSRQSSVYKLFNVPKSLAQTIIDDWGDEGRSADAVYSEGTHFATLTLSDRDAVKDNLSTGWMYSGCDQKFQEHFAWGYTKAEITNWIDVTGFTNTPSMPPITRNLRITERGDGLFNAIMSERTFEAVSATNPQFTITIPIGTNITRQTDYGYNYNATQMAAAGLQDVYNTTVAAVGKTVEFRVTREDDCSFDWVAIITEQDGDILGDITTGTGGVWRASYSMRGATTGEVASLEASIPSGPRTNVTLNITMRDDNLADVQAGVVVVQINTNSYDSGTGGVRVQEQAGVNADSVPTNLTSTRLRSVSPQIQPGEDGTFNYRIAAQTVVETNGSWTIGNKGAVVTMAVGNNKASLTNPAVSSSSDAGVIVDLVASYDDAGNLQYNQRSTQKNKVSEDAVAGSSAYTITIESATGDTTAGGPADKTAAQGTAYDYNLDTNPDGTTEWVLRTIGSQPLTVTVTMATLKPTGRAGGYTESSAVFRNQLTATAWTGSYGYYKRLTINDDNTYDGEVVSVTYDLDPATVLSNFAGGTYTSTERMYDYQMTGTSSNKIKQYIYHELTWTYVESVNTSYVTALTAISGGDAQRSGVSVVVVAGQRKYLAKKATYTSITGPTTIGGTWYYDLRSRD